MGGFYPVHLHYSDLHYSDVDFPNSLQLAVPPGSLALHPPEEDSDQQSRTREHYGDPEEQLPPHAAILQSAGSTARITGQSKRSLRVSGNSEGIGEPTKSSVVVSAAVVVAHKQLIHEDGGKDLSLVVDESAMPRTRVQFEE